MRSPHSKAVKREKGRGQREEGSGEAGRVGAMVWWWCVVVVDAEVQVKIMVGELACLFV